MLALNNSLLKEFIKIFLKKEQFEINDKLKNLIKFIQLPVVVSTHQNISFKKPQIAKQQRSLIKIVEKNNDTELVKSTILKLMLVDEGKRFNFTTVNIFQDEIDIRYSATFTSGKNRDKAVNHIKALLEDSKKIEIWDRYITQNWNDCKEIIKRIMSDKEISLKIVSEPQINSSQKKELKKICNKWDIKGGQYNRRKHDRYILTEKLEILLSSGLLYLGKKTADLTYTIKIRR